MKSVIGWDIGGAHLKAARTENGRVTEVRQLACPLWLGMDNLRRALAEALAGWPMTVEHAVTMTGELSDIFPDRNTGVVAILNELRRELSGTITIYGIDGEFLSMERALAAAKRVASANWHATARWLAQRIGHGLLVDVGSTTTDVVPLKDGKVAACGVDDAERLISGELLYQGIVRTPIMAVVRDVVFGGERVRLMSELFATMGDIYRLTNELSALADLHATADGRGKTPADSRARLARMLGRDASSATNEAWGTLARHIANRQLHLLQDAAEQVLSAILLPADAPFIGAGTGRFMAEELARRLRHPYRDFAELVPADESIAALAADCAPAVAVALLRAANDVSSSTN
jgi:(4-(4-[2-(gamma-L-glutamylamino)ethyl]phenoxymethyl)furan-2-yl)methanamine synthase